MKKKKKNNTSIHSRLKSRTEIWWHSIIHILFAGVIFAFRGQNMTFSLGTKFSMNLKQYRESKLKLVII